ncbi:MAG: SDR family oxidoreductase [Gemmatimonadota bacterium]|nr:SDR family oxidoreductase [Gemmatimonadota bacterium]
MFNDKVVAITGASSGLGATLALAFADEGADLALFALDEGVRDTAQACRERGSRAVTAMGDVGKPEDCEAWIDAAVAGLGGVDYLIACAGISMWARFDEVEDLAIFRKLMETNYLGIVHCVYYALPHLKVRDGMVVAISSIQGKIGVPLHTGYVASKHAVQGFFESLRTELSDTGVDVLTVLPHWLRGTNLRKAAFGKHGGSLGASSRKHSKESISLDDASQAIIEAMKKRKRELIIPFKLRFLPWLHLINPKIVEYLVTRGVSKQENG